MSSKKKKPVVVQEKHKLIFKEISENGGKGNNTMTKAVVNQGYSLSYALGGKIKKTKSWHELVETHLSDEKLAQVHNRLLNAREIKQLSFNKKLKDEDIEALINKEGYTFISTKRFQSSAVVFFSVPDGATIRSALEMAYKLKGKYGDTIIKHQFSTLSDEDLEQQIADEVLEMTKTSTINKDGQEIDVFESDNTV